MMTAETVKTRLTSTVERAQATKSFRFERPRGYAYEAGQFSFLAIPGDDTPMRKHFSFSSSPTEGFVEFTTRLSGSDYKNALDALMPGTEVEIGLPHGNFTLAHAQGRKIAFLSGGIGITPIRSICRFATDRELPIDIVVLYGNRDSASTAFAEDLAQMERSSEWLRAVLIMSEPEETWTGPTGRIDRAFIEAQVPDYRERTFFTCGPPGMVQAMRDLLLQMGLGAARIVEENFTGY